jgi:TRAP-type C4-dicarboxylate transport system substrate-binding protein
MTRLLAACLLMSGVAFSGTAHAEPRFVLRIATAAPEGTAWAREMAAMTREVDAATRGEVRVKFILGGIAGSELEAGERVSRGQIDGVASGGPFCQKVSPSFGIAHVFGLYESRDEISHTLNNLRAQLDGEFNRSGFVLVGWASLGQELWLLPRKVTTFAELRAVKLWRWNMDPIGIAMDRLVGLASVTDSIENASTAVEQGRAEGFISVPQAILAFQWLSRARYFMEPRLSHLYACLVLTTKAFERMPIEHQQVVASAAAKLAQRIEDVSAKQDEQLTRELFPSRGLERMVVPDALRAELKAASRATWTRVDEKLVPKGLIEKARVLVEEFRARKTKK